MGIASAGPASAQILKRGVQGGVAGAVIGGIVDGGSGAGKGAAIGAGVGLAAGAIEKDYNKHRAAPPPGYATPPRYANAMVADTQASLLRLGYNPGPVDGVMGPGTRQAISNYQYAWGLPVTGSPSPQLLDHMRRHGG